MNNKPRIKPKAMDPKISIRGDKAVAQAELWPGFSMELTVAMAKPNAIMATASSKATTLSMVFVTGPFALYCFTTIIVAAGAVAAAMAPKRSEIFVSKPQIIKTPDTKTEAKRASNKAITMGVAPAFFK